MAEFAIQEPPTPPPAPVALVPGAAPVPPKTDPLTERLKESMRIVIDETKTNATKDTATLPVSYARTLGERALEVQELEAIEAAKLKEPTKPVEPPKVEAPVAPAPVVPAKEEPKVEVKPPRTEFVDPGARQPAPPQPPPTPPRVEPVVAETADEQFIKTLTDEEREEYDLAVYASKANTAHASKPAEVLSFLKKVQQFTTANPTAEADSQEFKEFIEKNKPDWRPGERNKLTRKMIEDAAVERTKSEFKREMSVESQKTQAKLREVEARPMVEKQVQRFTAEILKDRSSLPVGVDGIPDAVLTDAQTMTQDQLIAAHPVEGPVVAQHLYAAKEFEKLVSGAIDFNPQNQAHSFLVNFLNQQESTFAKAPMEQQTVNGSSWVPRAKMTELLETNPEQARHHWCFNDDQVRKMLAFNAHSAAHNRIESLSKSGFVRPKIQKVESAPAPVPAAEPTKPAASATVVEQPHKSPKAGVSTSPGAAETGHQLTEGQRFIRERIPGYKFPQPA